jgi:type IV pilus assembly protein PilQ
VSHKKQSTTLLSRSIGLALLLGCSSLAFAQAATEPATVAAETSVAPLTANASPAKEEAAKSAGVQVKNIEFSKSAENAGIMTLTFDGPAAEAEMRNVGSNVVVDITNGTIEDHLRKMTDVASFGTPMRQFTAAQNGKNAQFVINANGDYKSMAYQAGNKFVVELTPHVEPPKAVGSVLSAMTATVASTTTKPVYRGKPVTFSFQDVPVRTILQLLAEESGVSIVAADTVQGNVTLRLTGIPWDQALDLVLQTKSLDKRTNGKVIWVAPQSEIAKFEQDKEDARIALDNRVDMQTEYVQINYHRATEIFKALTEAKGIGGGGTGEAGGGGGSQTDNGFLSPRGKIVADARTNTLIVSDIPKKLEQMKQLIDVIDRPVDQVMIEARVVIANDSFARELGARFGISGYADGGRTALNSTIENNITTQNSIAAGSPTIPRGLMSNLGVLNPAGSVALSILRSNFALDFELSAMQKEGRGEVISNPRLLTSNQREAVISQGQEVGYVTLTPAAVGAAPTPNVQFKDVLLEMKVTPTITDDGRVFLDMNVKKDEVSGTLDTGIGMVPQISKRAVNTAVLIEDGQTVVIGGVYEFTDRKDISKVPFLGDIPFLGNLFKKRGSTKQKAELLIMVTPRVMRVAKRPPTGLSQP